MVVLFVAHNIYHLVYGVVLVAHLCRTDVLCHIYAGAVGAEQQFLVETFVSQVSPYRVVLMSFEESFLQSFLHLRLTLQVSLAFVVYLVEAYAESFVCLVEAGIYPVVHLLPQSAHLGVVLFPLHQHVVSLLNQRSLLFCLFFVHALAHKFFHFLAVVLVEGYVVVADEVVALLAAALWSLSVAPFLPGEHRLTDVNTSVVNYVCLHHAVAVSLHNLCQRPS